MSNPLRGGFAFDWLMANHRFETVLDIGSGGEAHQNDVGSHFQQTGKVWKTLNLYPPADYVCRFPDVVPVDAEFDVVWCSHVLEHATNVQLFLRAAMRLVKPEGLLAIVVPNNERERVLGGHLNAFNEGRLLYNMAVAGIDCSQAHVRRQQWETAVITPPLRFDVDALPLKMDNGDIELLAPYFPMPVKQGMNGQIERVNW
jgi:SAM-dependent methyltransferase